jgi:glyoxylate reductase
MTMALILAVPRRLAEGAASCTTSKWSGWSPTWMLGRRIWGKRLGIVGMGRIGTAVARRAKAFGLSIHYHNRHRVAQPPSRTSWRRPIGRASTRCWPAWTSSRSTAPRRRRRSTCCRPPAGADASPTAYIVNTARGDIIDEDGADQA